MELSGDSMGYEWDVPSGKRLQKMKETSTIFNGKIHYFDWAMASSSRTVTVITEG